MAPIRIARGVRATEASLLAAVLELAADACRDPTQLAKPVRLVVPSRSLRAHLAAQLVRARGGALAGVVVHTLRGLAFEILKQTRTSARGGDLLFPLIVRRCAREQPALREVLDPLREGYGVVTATVSDLLDAGFEPFHLDPVEDCLAEAGDSAEVERARAVARVAAQTCSALAAVDLEHRSGLFRRAREVLEQDPEGTLPARAVLLHGYADVTGTQLELLEALVRWRGAQIWVDQPDDPGAVGRPDPGGAFTEWLLERLSGLTTVERLEEPAPAGPGLRLLRAPGAQAESRAVAERVRSLLDAGARPEGIGLVVRDWTPYASALRTQLRRLGIPFSGGPGSPGPLNAPGRRLAALFEILRSRAIAPADRWIEAGDGWEPGEAAAPMLGRGKLRAALHALGLGRLGQIACFEPEAGRGADRQRVADAVRRAAGLMERLAGLEEASRLGDQLSGLESLVAEDLRWDETADWSRAFRSARVRLRGEVDPAFPCSLDEVIVLLERALASAGTDSPGGNGAGVQVLSVTEARARSFEHLFLLGMNRDLFPRGVSEDPLLGDEIRRRLQTVLPYVPIKGRGFDEERYLFAQLVSASPEVTLSWQAVSDDGKEKTVSPLVERLRIGIGLEETELAPVLYPDPGAEPGQRTEERPAFEHAVLAGLHGGRSQLQTALELGLLEAGVDQSLARSAARARVAVLEEFERGAGPEEELGPYLGFIGALRGAEDPRRKPLWVTALEGIARCPWQSFLERSLRLRPLPDALSELPQVSALLVGNLLHRSLERIVARELPETGGHLAEVVTRTPRKVPWPSDAELESILQEEAVEVLRREGVEFAGFSRLLVDGTRLHLIRIGEIDWPGGVAPGVLGAEVQGEVEVALSSGERFPLRFRADRVDATSEGIHLTDYKSGKPLSEAKQLKTRQGHLLREVVSGRRLQAAAYAFARGVDPGAGRYVFARPDLEAAGAVAEVHSSQLEVREAFATAAGRLLDLREAGSFFPRLLDPRKGEEPASCSWCEVSLSCLRGDMTARRRLLERLGGDVAPSSLGPTEGSARAVWMLGEQK